jgi:hypothetical protein
MWYASPDRHNPEAGGENSYALQGVTVSYE